MPFDKMKDIRFNHETEQLYEQFLRDRANAHRNLKYYANSEAISAIVNDGILRLSNGNDWNDSFDANLFNAPDYDYVQFGKCFSFSRTESVAMWAIYGKENDGCMIDFGEQLKKIADTVTGVRIIRIGKVDKSIETLKERDLKEGEFEIFLRDVLYISESEDGSYTIKRSDERIEKVPNELINPILGCCKNMPWSYENECRLIVRIPKKLLRGIEYNVAEISIPKEIKTILRRKVIKSPMADSVYPFAASVSALTDNVRF